MLRERAYAELKRNLATGALAPGQFVSQRELVRLIGLPLAPVRDAIRRLEAEGLVQVVPQRGISVTALDADIVREGFELRRALEIFAARRFCEAGDPGLVAPFSEELRRLADRLRTVLTPDLAQAAVDIDGRLHLAVVASLDNGLYLDAYRGCFEKLRFLRRARRFSRERFLEATTEHLEIVAALAGRDPDAAAGAVDRHIEASLRHAVGLRP